jgi:uncharacterized membrane protein YdbT with pleckstrin-like domain
MSSYVQSVLGSGERVQYEAKVSIWSMLPLLILGGILLPLYGFGLLFWLIAYLRYISTELAITNKKIIAKFGFIKRNTIEILLPKVQTIEVHQTLFGRMLNYGSIIVTTGGGLSTAAPVPGISDPIHFRKQFMEIQEQLGAKA